MGRPRKENAMTSTERSRKYRLDPDNCLVANKTEEEIKSLDQTLEWRWTGEKENDKLFKKSSFSNESITSKKVGLKLKDRNRKRKNSESWY